MDQLTMHAAATATLIPSENIRTFLRQELTDSAALGFGGRQSKFELASCNA